jgi:hypothetical protein
MPVLTHSHARCPAAAQNRRRGLETFLPTVVGDHVLQPLHILLFLRFQTLPEILQIDVTVGIGDVLIVAPQSIEPLAQLVNHIVIVIGGTLAFADVCQFFFGGETHDEILR